MAGYVVNPVDLSVAVAIDQAVVNKLSRPSSVAFVPAAGEAKMLQRAVGNVAAEDVICRLFVNNVAESESTVYTDFTSCTLAGYAPVTLNGTWTVTEDGTAAVITHASVVFNLTGTGETIYGAWFTYAAVFHLCWMQKFSSPIVVPADGANILVTPKLKFDV